MAVCYESGMTYPEVTVSSNASWTPLVEVPAEIPEDGEVTLSLRVTVVEAKKLLSVAMERDVSLTALLRSMVDEVTG